MKSKKSKRKTHKKCNLDRMLKSNIFKKKLAEVFAEQYALAMRGEP